MFKISKPVLIAIGVVVLAVLVLSSRESGDAGASTGSGDCRFTVNADILNVRPAPNTNGDPVGTLEDGAEASAEATVRNGFRKLDDGRWVAGRYLTPVEGSSCR